MEIILNKKSILLNGKKYLEKFKDKVFVVKHGGSNLDNQQITRSILEDIVFLHSKGINVAVVHGGASAISKLMQEKGKDVQFNGGLRVTDEETANIVDEALRGVNAGIVEEIKSLGGAAKSIISRAQGVIKARKAEDSFAGDFRGDVDSIKTEKIKDLFSKNIIPVISPVGIGPKGKLYNINADFASAGIAIALKSEKLIFLTNVKGIMKNHIDEKTLISSITEKKIEQLIKENKVSSGMIPKARAGIKALSCGVKKIHIISGGIRHSLLIEVLTDEGIGTEIVF